MSDLCIVFRNLHSISRAGLSLAPGCRKLAETAKPELAAVWTELAAQLEAGCPLSAALGQTSLSVDSWMREMIQAGEASGTTDQILQHIATEVESLRTWRRSLLARLVYPLAVLHLTAFLPALPLLLSHGNVIALAWIITFLTIIYLPLIAAWSLNRIARQSQPLRYLLESLLLRVPAGGAALRAACSARFYRALGALARASSRWEDAVHCASQASGSAHLQQSAALHHAALAAGAELTATLQQFSFFPVDDLDQLNTGEITGTLHETLDRLSVTSRENATRQLKLFSLALSVGVYGLCIGGILLAMLSILGPVYYQVYELLNH